MIHVHDILLQEWVINSKTLGWEEIFHCSSRYDILPWIQLRWFSKPKLHLLSMPYSELKSILQNWFHSSIWIVCPSITINLVRKGRQDFAPCCFFLKFGQEKVFSLHTSFSCYRIRKLLVFVRCVRCHFLLISYLK